MQNKLRPSQIPAGSIIEVNNECFIYLQGDIKTDYLSVVGFDKRLYHFKFSDIQRVIHREKEINIHSLSKESRCALMHYADVEKIKANLAYRLHGLSENKRYMVTASRTLAVHASRKKVHKLLTNIFEDNQVEDV